MITKKFLASTLAASLMGVAAVSSGSSTAFADETPPLLNQVDTGSSDAASTSLGNFLAHDPSGGDDGLPVAVILMFTSIVAAVVPAILGPVLMSPPPAPAPVDPA